MKQTDLEKFINLYKGFGIELGVEDILVDDPVQGKVIHGSYIKLGGWSCDARLLEGYSGFYSG